MTATIQTIQKPKKARALDTSTSYQEISQELVTNGTFTNWTGNNPDNWSVHNEDGSNHISESGGGGGAAVYVSDNSEDVYISQAGVFEVGKTYIVRMDCTAHTAGSVNLYYTSTTGGSTLAGLSGTGSLEHIFTPDYSTTLVITQSGSTVNLTFDNVSVKEVESFSNNNHGQIYSGRALEFDGISDNLQIIGAPGGSSEIAGVNSFDEGVAYSWCTWIYLNSHSNTKNWFLGNGVTNPQIRIIEADGRLSIREDASAAYYYISSTGLKLKTWYRLVITADTSNNLKCYLNGVLDNTLSEGDSPWSGSGTFGVGGSNLGTQFQMVCLGNSYLSGGNQYPLDGMLSDFQIWDTTLTADDVLYDYNNPEQLALNRGGTSLTNSNLKVWYPMNDGHRGQQSYILDASNTGLGDELVSNGSFDGIADGTSAWTLGGGWAEYSAGGTPIDYHIYDGKLKITQSAANMGAAFQFTAVSGVTYKYSMDISGDIGSSVYVSGNVTAYHYSASSGANEFYLTATGSGTTNLYLRAAGNTTGVTTYYDNISIKPVNNKHHATTEFYGDDLWNAADNNVAMWTASASVDSSIVSSEAAIGDSTGPVKIIPGTPYSSYVQLRSEANSQDVLDNDLVVGRQYSIYC
jgi:hypothetical protein